MTVDYKYDIAISFLSRDEPLASELYGRLSQQLAVFVYSKKQEDLAGTNGIESFQAAFRSQARFIVVLYRDGWGETPWTRIEQTAITERVLSEGWNCLFFVMLDRAATPPKWFPKTYIRFNFEEYGLEQAIGAIKGRLQEIGGSLKPLDVIQQAKLVDRRRAFFEEREHLFNSNVGVKAVHDEILTMYKHVESRIAEIRSSTGIIPRFGRDNFNCVITDDRISVTMSWRPRAANRLDHSPLIVREFNSQILLPGERGYYPGKSAKLSEQRYDPERSVEIGWCWVADSKPKEYLSSVQVGDRCVAAFLRLVDLVASGGLEPPNFLDEDE